MSEKDNIFVFDDIISDEICNDCISIIDRYAVNDESEYIKDTKVKANSFMLNDSTSQTIEYEIRKDINEKLYGIMNKLIHSICKKRNLTITSDSGFQFRKIYGETQMHTDGIFRSYGESIEFGEARLMAVIIALNGDYDGGQFYFPNQDVTIKLKKGQIITFPPFWTHPHATKTLENNTFRYTINTWLCGIS